MDEDPKMYKRISELIESGLWPASKTPVSNPEAGLYELLQLGYIFFYKGKNGDIYLSPHAKNEALLVRSDRCSVFDIPLSDTIEGKGVVQNQLSLHGAKFAEAKGIKTAGLDMPTEIPEHIAARSQYMELCKPLSMMFEGKEVGLELIFRNYRTGSLHKKLSQGIDPYELGLDTKTPEWSVFSPAIFTPTTKGVSDDPIPSHLVEKEFPEMIGRLAQLFLDYSNFCKSKGIIAVDTKFEVFINSKGEWCLGDEILTPESSRFIPALDFLAKIYLSMDKQILRNYGELEGWLDYKENNPKGAKLYILIPPKIKSEVLLGYESVFEHLYAA